MMCKQDKTSTSMSYTNCFTLEVTTTDYNVKQGPECQCDISEFLHDTQTL
jgi:hypothetical protein